MPGTGFEFPKAGELLAWSRILDGQEAICSVNPNGATARGGDIFVSTELCRTGTEFTVIANTAQAMGDGSRFTGTYSVGSKLRVNGLNQFGKSAFIEAGDVAPAEVLVLIKDG